MSRLPELRRFSGDNRRRRKISGPVKLLQSHNKRIRVLCQFYNGEALRFSSLITAKASADLYAHALLNSRVAQYDMKVYETYSDIIKSYVAVSAYYKENEKTVLDEGVHEILDGLDKILASRLAEFGWTKDRANPIEEEKIKLLDQVLKSFYAGVSEELEKYFPLILGDVEKRVSSVLLLADHNALAVIHQGVLDIVLDRLVDGVYDVYCQSFVKAMGALDNLDNRLALNDYLTALKQEYDILESIIKVQVVALEKNANGDSETVQWILTEMREAYQFAGKSMQDIESLMKAAGEKAEAAPASLSSFRDGLDVYITEEKPLPGQVFEEVITAHNKHIKFLLQKMKSEVIKAVEHSFNDKGVSQSDKENPCFNIEKMTNEIVQVFHGIIAYTNENTKDWDAEDQNTQIIHGIRDTIDIKITSILEATSELKAQLEEKHASLGTFKPGIPEEQVNIAVKDIYTLWVDTFSGIVDINKETVKIAEDVVNGQIRALVRQALDQYEKGLAKEKEAVSAAILSYQRNTLLFEISTFGEIMAYSVSRLRESEDEPCKAYTKMIDKAEETINLILEENGIGIIDPKPHESFNGKEHEVLMAESREGFEKGQIIKVSNCGYRQGENVIIRANVIAAR